MKRATGLEHSKGCIARKDSRSSGSYQGSPLTQPELGQPISTAVDHACRKRSSAERQAER